MNVSIDRCTTLTGPLDSITSTLQMCSKYKLMTADCKRAYREREHAI